MKRLSVLLLAVAALAAAVVSPAPALAATAWSFQVVDEYGRAITSGATCHVYNAGLTTTATIYSNAILTTTKTNPITVSSGGLCEWFGATTTTTYDVVVFHKRARARQDAMTAAQRRIIVNLQPSLKALRIPWVTTASGEINTGVTLPKGAMVIDVAIEVTTAGAGQSLDVGLLSSESGGDADGFCAKRAITATGFVRCGATSDANGLTQNHRGVLLLHLFQAAGATHKGFYLEKPHLADGTATTITYTKNEAGTAAAGFLHILYYELQSDL